MSDYSPFLGPYLKALSLKAFAENLAAQKEEREQRRQLFQSELEQRTRQNQLQDLQTTHALQTMGALPVAAGIPGNFQAALGGRAKPLDTPVGRYSMPSTAQAQGYAASEARRAGILKGIEKKSESDVADPDVEVPLPGPAPGFGATVTVPESKRLEAMLKAADLYTKRNPHLIMKDTPPNNQGDIIRTWNDPTKGEKMRLLLPGAGKTARPAATNNAHPFIPNEAAERKKLAEEWRPGVYNQFGITDEIIAASKTNGTNADPANRKIQHAEGELDKAITRELQNRARAPKAQTASAAASPSSVKATELNDLLKRANTKRTANGLPPLDINGLRKELAGRGVTIQE